MTLALIDYGAGNLMSISNAFIKLGEKPKLVTEPEQLESADRIILPGVGNFGSAMQRLDRFRRVLIERIEDEVPFLGLCLGIHVILDSSEESPGVKGLGILKGTCKRFPFPLKIPHMGWNSIKIGRENKILKRISSEDYFYFVHSYYPVLEDDETIIATTEYWGEFPSVIAKGNVFATQFHPEKSADAGLRILRNFLKSTPP